MIQIKILCTGHRGFIGKHLYRRLEKQGHKLTGIDKKENRMHLSNFRIANETIRDFKPDVVIHLAATSNNNQLDNLIDNVVSSVNVFEACEKNKVPWVIFASSAAVYGNQNKIVTEMDITNPSNVYGSSKQYIENIMLTYSFNKTILRLSNVYGDGGRGVLNRFTYCVKNNIPIKINGDGTQIRDFIHIEDVLGFLEFILAKQIQGLYNVATGIPTRIVQLCSLIDKFKKGSCTFEKMKEKEIFYSCLKSNRMLYRNKIKLEEGIRRLMVDEKKI